MFRTSMSELGKFPSSSAIFIFLTVLENDAAQEKTREAEEYRPSKQLLKMAWLGLYVPPAFVSIVQTTPSISNPLSLWGSKMLP